MGWVGSVTGVSAGIWVSRGLGGLGWVGHVCVCWYLGVNHLQNIMLAVKIPDQCVTKAALGGERAIVSHM